MAPGLSVKRHHNSTKGAGNIKAGHSRWLPRPCRPRRGHNGGRSVTANSALYTSGGTFPGTAHEAGVQKAKKEKEI
nr:MAG TPA: hypothetical protein [Bacteriophage sp.]